MTSRAWVATIVAAVVCGVAGYFIGASSSPSTAQIAPPPPPPPPEQEKECTYSAALTYTNDGQPKLILNFKDLETKYPTSDPSRTSICWTVFYSGTKFPFDSLKVDGVVEAENSKKQKLFTGDLNFRGLDRVKAFFNAKPDYPGGNDFRLSYEVVGVVGGQQFTADPSIIIKP